MAISLITNKYYESPHVQNVETCAVSFITNNSMRSTSRQRLHTHHLQNATSTCMSAHLPSPFSRRAVPEPKPTPWKAAIRLQPVLAAKQALHTAAHPMQSIHPTKVHIHSPLLQSTAPPNNRSFSLPSSVSNQRE